MKGWSAWPDVSVPLEFWRSQLPLFLPRERHKTSQLGYNSTRSFPIQSQGLFLFIPLSFWKSFPRTYFQAFYQGNANRSVCLIPLPGSRLNCSDTTIGVLTVSDTSTTFLLHFQYLQFTLKRDKGPSPSFIKTERRMASQVSGNKPAISWMCR